MREVFEATLERIEELGGEVAEVALPHAEHGISAYYVIAPAEASSNLARYDGVRYGLRAEAAGDLLEMYETTRAEGFGAEVKRRIMLGTYALSSGYYDAYYGQAQKVRTKIAEDFAAAFERFDFVVTPTSPSVAFGSARRPTTRWRCTSTTTSRCRCRWPASRRSRSRPASPSPTAAARSSRSASRSPPRPSPSRSCSTPPSRSSRRSASTPGRRGWAMAEYEAVIGLEIHVQLATRTKMFCGCELSFGDEPNVHTCPVCLAHPGVLPVPNEKAIRYALMIAAALGCEVAPRSIFHRKNYFYPDNPKAYQISQYDIPLATGGRLGEVRIHRVHLEEDAAKMIHVGESGRIHGSGASLVDFNRAGTPLVEIVTEPDLRSASEVRAWAQLLQETVRQLGVSDVRMEEGSLRVDGNVSLRPAGSEELGIKTELKNMNSFRFLEHGIEAEIERQRALLEAGGGNGYPGHASLRPRQPHADAAALEGVRARLPLLPRARPGAAGADRGDAARGPRVAAGAAGGAGRALRGGAGPGRGCRRRLAADPETAAYFERATAAAAGASRPKVVANWVTGELAAALRQGGGGGPPPTPRSSPRRSPPWSAMVQEKKISHGSGKTVLAVLVAEGGDPAAIVEREGLAQMSGDSGELESIVAAAIEANPDAAEQIRAGNGKAIGAIVGAVMKETKGRADGGEVNRLIKQQLGV